MRGIYGNARKRLRIGADPNIDLEVESVTSIPTVPPLLTSVLNLAQPPPAAPSPPAPQPQPRPAAQTPTPSPAPQAQPSAPLPAPPPPAGPPPMTAAPQPQGLPKRLEDLSWSDLTTKIRHDWQELPKPKRTAIEVAAYVIGALAVTATVVAIARR